MLENDKKSFAFSVVIPLYNKEHTILRAINSVLVQTHQNFELIVVNDGSTDNSLAIVERIHHPSIRVISQLNNGVSTARNVGVQTGLNKYVCFLDADDAWAPGFLQEITALIEANPKAGLFCTRYDTVDEHGKRFIGSCSQKESFFGLLEDFFDSYAKSRSLICSSNVCINKDTFNDVGGFPVEASIGEDIYVWLLMALHCQVMFSSKTLATVYRNAENRTVNRLEIQTPYHLQVFLFEDKGKALMQKHHGLSRFIAQNTVLFAIYSASKGDRKGAVKYAKALLSLNPLGACLVFASVLAPNGLLEFGRKLRDRLTTAKAKI